MSVTFTKLFSSITESTIWCEPSPTRIVWITMLAMADKNGRVFGSIPGLANRAQVTLEEASEAISKFLSPDEWSRTKDCEGRRAEEIDGGWRLLNHAKYRALRDEEERKEYKKHWIAEKRSKEKEESVDNVDRSRPQYTYAEAEADAYKPKDSTSPSTKADPVPVQEIINLYHEKLPTLPKVKKVTKTRESYIRQRWREDMPKISQWENFFEEVALSDFLMGKTEPTNGRPAFIADLEWLTKAANFTKIAEGKYHRV